MTQKRKTATINSPTGKQSKAETWRPQRNTPKSQQQFQKYSYGTHQRMEATEKETHSPSVNQAESPISHA